MAGLSAIRPHEATIVLPKTLEYATIHLNDIIASQDATIELYAHFSYVDTVSVIDRIAPDLSWYPGVDVYIKATSADGTTFRYYVITVN
jgi:hypothetical protein